MNLGTFLVLLGNSQVQSLIRGVLKLAGGALIAKGVISAETIDTIGGRHHRFERLRLLGDNPHGDRVCPRFGAGSLLTFRAA